MSFYLGVTAVERKGKRVDWYYQKSQPYIPRDHRLVAVMDNGFYRVALSVTDPHEFKAALRSYNEGKWLDMVLYLLPERLVSECPNEGRAPSTYCKGV